MCVCACVRVCVCVCVCMHACVCAHVCVHVCVCACMHVRAHACVCACVCVCMHMRTCVCVCACDCKTILLCKTKTLEVWYVVVVTPCTEQVQRPPVVGCKFLHQAITALPRLESGRPAITTRCPCQQFVHRSKFHYFTTLFVDISHIYYNA